MLVLEINSIVGFVANYLYLVLGYLGNFLYYKTLNWLALRKFTWKNYSHIQVTMILPDGIPSLGQLIMPTLTLAINLSLFLLLKLNQSKKKKKFQQKRKKAPTVMRWIYIDNTRLW